MNNSNQSAESAPSVNNYRSSMGASDTSSSSRPSSTTPPYNDNSDGENDEVMELHAVIREKTDEVIHSAGHDKLFQEESQKIALAERLHGENANIDFLKSIITDLDEHGPNAQSYKDALKLFDFGLSLSPLDQYDYLVLIFAMVSIIATMIFLFWSKNRKKKKPP